MSKIAYGAYVGQVSK